MADVKKKQLGIFWDYQGLYFVETEQAQAKKIISIPIAAEILKKAENNPLSPDGSKVITTIQDILRKNKMTNNVVHLSLPSRDIIFRSFLIPWMQSKEIKSVVEFEATKYIPFTLKELAYSYHAMNLMEGSARRLRVVFVAIKKDTLSRYTKLLDEAALNVQLAEPAPLSLIRSLVHKERLQTNQTTAIIDKREKIGKIVIVQGNTPLFVREFPLMISSNPALDASVEAAELLRLTNEVRISLDYFNRQEKSVKVEKIIFLSPNEQNEFAKALEEDLEMSMEIISCSSILNNDEIKDTHFINAYGAGLKNDVNLEINFDLSKDKPQTVSISRQTFQKNFNIKEVLPTAFTCLLISFLAIGSSKFFINKQKNELTNLYQRLGPSKDISIDMLNSGNDGLQKKLNAYKSIRLKSDITFFLAAIAQLLPEGAWVNGVNFSIQDIPQPPSTDPQTAAPKPAFKTTMELTGLAYSPQKKDQFQQINSLLQAIKDNERFNEYFPDIKLEDVRSQFVEGYEVTAFIIRFQ
ncbi:MAG TPA: pilus assembly protein PilM [Candidatus Omnitrophota bacterium]|nr:pilus assembly protein PilM [Candidatus Omnitrophota bacterium]